MGEIVFKKMYLDDESYAQNELDKNLLKLSGGAFAISFIFIDKLIMSNPIYTWLLVLSWVYWVTSILTVLLSYRYCVSANRVAFQDLEYPDKHDKGVELERTSNRIIILNDLSIYSFILGVLAMIIFISINFEVR